MAIDWLTPAEMPTDWRDGRKVLVADPNRLGTDYGGDGVKLDPRWPYRYYIARWSGRAWEATEAADRDGDPEVLYDSVDLRFAELTPPL